ncbi:alkylhydroperoxidase like protein, AhpD family [Ktedonobacter racemifer DSM 44963]|uniref:Alkylhydroperoxidase like protein, AhpD family n=1 Tax=Ktedonobacter racemifer DSM 44963 TaxID=485913 RepID=D6TBF9_KTERA|nr:carboxymuconolactone decarboxylase family protein [Ktedonobacter racemifer]EFH87943.1 alkylhydroperoxidase like protein, AhpD family [Ktedonobacter racemifer DSM 44963]
MRDLEAYLAQCGLEPSLLDLTKTRASQINGCAYWLDMHTKDARKDGESEQRLYALDAWRETPFYTEGEQAALAWTEAVTLITSGHVPDELYQGVGQHFTEEELVYLTLAMVAINGWNRLTISFAPYLEPTSHQSGSEDLDAICGASDVLQRSSGGEKTIHLTDKQTIVPLFPLMTYFR